VVPVDELSSSEVETSSLNEMLHEWRWLDRSWCLGNLEYERYVAHCTLLDGERLPRYSKIWPFLAPLHYLQPH
jgi:hypothetical protein